MSVDPLPSKVGRGLCASLIAATFALANLGAEAALVPRDIDGDGVPDAYYDTAQNITWLADWNASGQLLTWDQAVAWAAALNVGGITGWRLPAITDTGNAGCDFSAAGGTDCGYNVDTGSSELARMWYVTFGNLAFCPAGNPNCDLQGAGQPGWGLINSGPFRNVQSEGYWSGTAYAPDGSRAWNFGVDDGSQGSDLKSVALRAVAVHAGDVAPTALAYKVVDLTPPGLVVLSAQSAGGGQQVGSGGSDPSGDFQHALLWMGTSGSVVDLHPPGFNPGWVESRAMGVGGRQQVGSAIIDTNLASHAMLWKGTAASFIDLTPNGFWEAEARGADLRQQVGWGSKPTTLDHALLWSGSAASAVDLHPAGFIESHANGVGDGQQAGDGDGHALLWTGSAASVVDLHPAGFTSSFASGVAGGQQVGFGGQGGINTHALLWTGSAASVVDLHPAGFVSSNANAVAGRQQAGYAYDGTTFHAMLWSGSAASAIDLHTFLPAGFSYSQAWGIDDAGTIVGYVSASNGSHAFMWVPALPYSLGIAKHGAPSPVPVGGQITYTITITNNLSGTATGVTVIDALPVGLTFVSATPSQGTCTQSTGIVCNLGSLLGSASAQVAIVVTAMQEGTVSNVASVGADEFVNNSATEVTTVIPSADLSITKTDSPDPVNVGSNLTYTITVKNAGPSTATGVAVQDTLPGGVTFVSSAASQGSCSGSAVVNCNLGTLAGAASAKVTIVIKPTQTGTLSNTASVVANEPDPNTTNNSATQTTTVNAVPLPDLTASWTSASQKCSTKRGKMICTVNGKLNVFNQGTANAKATTARFYVSDDAILDASDVLLAQSSVAALSVGKSKPAKLKAALAAGASASGKFVIVVIDPNNVISESDESNNVVVSARLP